ncbi:MAG: hypothetical protein HY834_18690 [Devosia nanyangense]|uniref:Uncharacterized protein n=1 Tax=Devosia nanyangense TaxID=1228055 RepID=A0A933L7J0_9HYPH|nr:hypothetical protein [Devosia nanyangense]
MTETVILPPEGRRARGPFIPPLLILPFLIYNLLGFTIYGGQPAGWANQIFQIRMVSGTEWALTSGDLLLVVGLVCLFFEVLKSTNTGRSSVIEHMVSTALFVVFLIEFLLAGAAASSVFFLLMIMSVVDVVAGFTISITGAGRDVTMG